MPGASPGGDLSGRKEPCRALRQCKRVTLEPESPAPAAAPDHVPAPQRTRLLRAAAFYFLIVFGAGMALGPIRVLWLEPAVGETLAVAAEAPFLILAMVIGAKVVQGDARGWASALAIGVLALVFQQTADLAVGFGLRGMTVQSQLDYFARPAGWIYGACLIAFALTPLIMRKR